MERAVRLQGLFYISLKFLIKISLNKEMFTFSQWPQTRSVLPCSPKAGPLGKQTPISRALLSISFEVPSKGAFPLGSLHRAPVERHVPLLSPLSSIFQSPRYTSPLPGSPMQPLWRKIPVSRAFSTYPPGSPVTESPLQVHLTEPPSREMLVSRALLQLSLRVPGERTSLINHLSFKVPSK